MAVADDVAKVADKLNHNMVLTMTWWSKGGVIQCDVPKSTQNALVKRGLAEWPPGEDLCASLTPFGLEVQAFLNAKAEAQEQAKMDAQAANLAAARAIRDEGHRGGQLFCTRQLYEAVYPGDSWPDRPLDTIWEHLLDRVRYEQGDHNEPGACKSALCTRPAGPHGWCRGHSCGDEVPASGVVCRLQKGRGGHWHDSGSQRWLIENDFTGPDPGEDMALFIDVVKYVLKGQFAAVSAVQRNVRIGFAKADRLVALMEGWGLVGPREGSAARKVLASADMLDAVLAAINAKSGQDATPVAPSEASGEVTT